MITHLRSRSKNASKTTAALALLLTLAASVGCGSAGENKTGEVSLRVNYKPQAQGILRLDLAESRQPVLEAGKRYVLELQGVPGSAPLFWRRTKTGGYPGGAAYMNRSLVSENSNTSDFAMALYGQARRQQ